MSKRKGRARGFSRTVSIVWVLFFAISAGVSAAEPALVYSVDPKTYAHVSASVQNLPEKGIVLYGSRAVSYSFEFDRSGSYFLKCGTAQVSSKTTPSEDYKFLFDIFVDDKKVQSNVPLSATKTHTVSDFIPLGQLSPGRHIVTLKWTNDVLSDTYDTNLGLSSLEIFRS